MAWAGVCPGLIAAVCGVEAGGLATALVLETSVVAQARLGPRKVVGSGQIPAQCDGDASRTCR